jgi:hypothetical protein
MKELPPAGSGNGGRTCFSCSCLLMGLMFLPPLLSAEFSFADTYALPAFAPWLTPTCLSTCCCVGVLMFCLSIWLILIDDPSKAK